MIEVFRSGTRSQIGPSGIHRSGLRLSSSGAASSTYATAVLATTGLVSYWRLNESVGPSAADSKGTNTGTYTGSPTLGVAGALTDGTTGVLFTSASSQYVTVPDNASLHLGDVFSIEVFVKRTATQGTIQGILCKGDNGYYIRFNADNTIHLLKAGLSDLGGTTTTITDTTTWHHIVCTKNAATTKLYVDGVDVTGTITNATILDTTQALTIGSGNTGASVPNEFSNLNIDEAAVYSVALSSATVSAHFAAR